MLQQVLTVPMSTSTCSPESIPYPSLFGAEFLSLDASVVSNYSRYVHEGYYLNHGAINVTNVSFCNVTLAYTHPGQNDVINVKAWLPLDTWNGRMQAVGGGGWRAGMFELSDMEMTGAVGEGYVTITTDGGHSAPDARDWALLSPGNINLYLLQDLASVSLNDVASIGKSLTQSFYGQLPKYSYWSGCSQGGRQGLMLAQRYPTAFDGIAASAPAINWGQLGVADYWPQLIMNLLGKYPHPCELESLTAAAVSACDGNDGVIDGIISDPDSCHFDPYTFAGTTINCDKTGHEMEVTEAAAIVANAAWTGARSSDGSFLWYGLNYDAPLTGPISISNTECYDNGTCIAAPFMISTDWIRLFIQKDPTFQFDNMTREDFDHIFHASVQKFTSIIGTNDPDLSEFRKAGGKMLTYHGLADSVITSKGSRHYYDAVSTLDPDVHSYYRLFESPGLAHCFGGAGGYPATLFDSLVTWVESDTAPADLTVKFTDINNAENHRILCPYPQMARYNGVGDPRSTNSFYCTT